MKRIIQFLKSDFFLILLGLLAACLAVINSTGNR